MPAGEATKNAHEAAVSAALALPGPVAAEDVPVGARRRRRLFHFFFGAAASTRSRFCALKIKWN
jgi:hypothetical protein